MRRSGEGPVRTDALAAALGGHARQLDSFPTSPAGTATSHRAELEHVHSPDAAYLLSSLCEAFQSTPLSAIW